MCVDSKLRGNHFVAVSNCLHLFFYARVELFNGKRGLVQGCIQSIDKSRVDFFAQEDQEVILPHGIMQWQVFAALGLLRNVQNSEREVSHHF
ncbi:unnamed protein product [Brassica rapa subsp. narinosa]